MIASCVRIADGLLLKLVRDLPSMANADTDFGYWNLRTGRRPAFNGHLESVVIGLDNHGRGVRGWGRGHALSIVDYACSMEVSGNDDGSYRRLLDEKPMRIVTAQANIVDRIGKITVVCEHDIPARL